MLSPPPDDTASGSARPVACRILVVGPAWVGDMVMAQSLFKVLHARHPGCQLDVLAPAWSEPLLARMPEVAASLVMPLGHGQLQLATRYRLGRGLAARGYRQAIVLPNSLKSAITPFAARIPRRTGYTGELRFGLLNDRRRLDKQALTMTVQRFVALGLEPGDPLPDPIPAPALQVDGTAVERARQRLGLSEVSGPVLALCPGAEFGAAKRWPEEKYAAVASRMQARGWQVWLFGSERDRPVSAAIAKRAPGCFDLAGRTSLEEAIDLLSAADQVITNDSGLMHVAAALDRPTVAIYGSSDPSFTPPLSPRARIVRLGLPCSPCFERNCPLGHLDCLRKLDEEQVMAALQDTA